MPDRTRRRFDRCDQLLEEMFRKLDQLPEEKLHERPAPDKWSVMETLQHLYVSESLSLRYLHKKLGNNAPLGPATWLTRLRTFLLNRVYLRLPIPYRAPAVVAEDQFDPELDYPSLKERWRAVRREMRQFLDQLPEETFDKEAFRHAVAGRMTLDGMLDFFHTHMQRHAGQIERTLASG